MVEDFVIKFRAIDSYAFNVAVPPIPASQYIPQWWKDMDPTTSNKKISSDTDPETYVRVTGKKCFPMLDSMTAGYILPLWADVEVSYTKDGDPELKWLTDRPVFSYWKPEITRGMEYPEDCLPYAFKFENQYVIETPPGWSCLFTHPSGYPNLPFRTISGLVDTDKLKTDINQPFWIKKGFTGVIPKGTPIAQIIPIQRANWETVVVEQMEEDEFYFNQQKDLKTNIGGAYGHHQREKKSYK